MPISPPPDGGPRGPAAVPGTDPARVNGHPHHSPTDNGDHSVDADGQTLAGDMGLGDDDHPNATEARAASTDATDLVILPSAIAADDWISPDPPQFITDLSEACVAFIDRTIGVRPDFTSDTLSLIDHYVSTAGADTTQRPQARVLVCNTVGAYFGEVVRKRFRAWWYAPSDDPSTWELRFRDVYLSFSPLAMIHAALSYSHGGTEEGASALRIDDADQEEVEAYLATLPEVPENEFFLPSTRFDTLESIVELLRAFARDRNLSDVTFNDEDYDDD